MKAKKRIFINASTVLISGGLILTQNILSAIQKKDSYDLFIICPNKKKYLPFIMGNTTLIIVPKVFLKRLARPFLDYIWIPNLINRMKPHLVFSLGNLPTITSFPQLYLHDNPYLTESDFHGIRMTYFTRIVHFLRKKETLARMKFVNHILAQTEYQKIKLSMLIRNIPITILPPSSPSFLETVNDFHFNEKLIEGKYKILCLSRYYEHKNIEKLIDVANLIKKENLPFVIYITVNPKHHKNINRLLKSIKINTIENTLINLGTISHDKVLGLIKKSDAIILPSLLESFSLVCIEAWKLNKPLFVSDIDSLKSACKDAAYYFNPYSEHSILNTLNNAFNNKKQLSIMIEKGKSRLSELPEWDECLKILDKLFDENCSPVIS